MAAGQGSVLLARACPLPTSPAKQPVDVFTACEVVYGRCGFWKQRETRSAEIRRPWALPVSGYCGACLSPAHVEMQMRRASRVEGYAAIGAGMFGGEVLPPRKHRPTCTAEHCRFVQIGRCIPLLCRVIGDGVVAGMAGIEDVAAGKSKGDHVARGFIVGTARRRIHVDAAQGHGKACIVRRGGGRKTTIFGHGAVGRHAHGRYKRNGGHRRYPRSALFNSTAGCSAVRGVTSLICERHENPGAATWVDASASRTVGARRRSAICLEMSRCSAS